MFRLKPTPIDEHDSDAIQTQFFEWERKYESALEGGALEKVHAWEDYFVRFA